MPQPCRRIGRAASSSRARPPCTPSAGIHRVTLVAIERLAYTAAAVGIPVETVMSRIARARDELRTIEDIGSMASKTAAGDVM